MALIISPRRTIRQDGNFLLLPDLPVEEAAPLAALCRRQELSLIPLITPTTPRDRAVRIAAAASLPAAALLLGRPWPEIALAAATGAQVVEIGPCNATIHKIDECVRLDELERLGRGVELDHLDAGGLEDLAGLARAIARAVRKVAKKQ